MQIYRLRAWTNEDFVLVLPVANLVDGAVVKCQFRHNGSDPDPAPLSFASDASEPGTITLDVPDQQITLSAALSVLEAANPALLGVYVFDIVQELSGAHTVIAAGTCEFLPGPTRI